MVVAASAEALTGLALIAWPALVVRLIFGESLAPIGFALGRVAGFGLLSLGVACWPRTEDDGQSVRALLMYNALATGYFSYLLVVRELKGTLLLPAMAIHALFTLLLIVFSMKREVAKSGVRY